MESCDGVFQGLPRVPALLCRTPESSLRMDDPTVDGTARGGKRAVGSAARDAAFALAQTPADLRQQHG